MVWLKDVTNRFQRDRRTLGDLDFPKELIFHLMRGSNTLTLNLRRNYNIDPNADVYVVRKLKDGGSYLEKTQSLEKEDVAYYQDIENGAFMTVGCARQSNGLCDRVINGNIRIRGSNYDLRLSETHVTSRDFLEVPAFLGKRYVLRDQANIPKELSVENKDTTKVNEKSKEQELIDLLRRFQQRQVKKDNTIHVYHVEVAAVIDKGIWDFFWSLVKPSNDKPHEENVQRAIRRFYANIFNGINLRYKGIEDSDIEINVLLRNFVMFQHEYEFQHKDSKVITANGMKSIDISRYLNDLRDWDIMNSWQQPSYDHAMLFSRYNLFENSTSNNAVHGLAWPGMVCELGNRTSVVKAGDYFLTVGTATHELAHSLGAVHDGDEGAKDCKSEDFFIMSKEPPQFSLDKPCSRNPWIFSNCTVEAFKKTLKDKDCVKTKGVIYDQTEWAKFTKKLPGEVYTSTHQCQLILGHKSYYCGEVLKNICLFLECFDPKTRRCHKDYFRAARGTSCGSNMWCIEGMCVPK